MLFKINLYLLLVSISWAQAPNPVNYEEYKIYNVELKTEQEKYTFFDIAFKSQYDFISLPNDLSRPVRIMIPPDDQFRFEHNMRSGGINSSVFNSNVGASIRYQNLHMSFARKPLSSFRNYHRLEDINAYLIDLAVRYSSNIFVKTLALSSENRVISGVIITDGNKRPDKKLILVDAGMNGREWIGISTALYIIYQLVENLNHNRELLKDADWFVVPLVNPDGYEYTHTVDRFWSKTRKQQFNNCTGTYIDHNFDSHWAHLFDYDRCNTVEPCSNIYKGPSPASEPETRAITKLINDSRHKAYFYLHLNSYGNYLSVPYDFGTNILSKYASDMYKVAQVGQEAFERYTSYRYKVSSTDNILCRDYGSSVDYATSHGDNAALNGGIPFAITMQLPSGNRGLGPSTRDILRSVSEMWIGIKAMVMSALDQKTNINFES